MYTLNRLKFYVTLFTVIANGRQMQLFVNRLTLENSAQLAFDMKCMLHSITGKVSRKVLIRSETQ